MKVLPRSSHHSSLGLLTAVLALDFIYRFVGDTSVIGGAITVWPPALWATLLVPRWLIGCLRRERNTPLVAVVLTTFVVSHSEVGSLWRREDRDKRGRFDAARRTDQDGRPIALRVMIWNVAGYTPIDTLAGHEPDLLLLTERGDLTVITRSPRFAGYHGRGGLDAGVVSRYPLTLLPTERVGPWTEPLALRVDLPGDRRLIVITARLVLPSVVTAVAAMEGSSRLAVDHRARVAQYPRLAQLARRVARREGVRSVIVAGDFNTPGGARSLDPLATELRDVWPEAGLGWGSTMTAWLPVSRIDQAWVSRDIELVSARVHRGEQSDHRLLLVDLFVP